MDANENFVVDLIQRTYGITLRKLPTTSIPAPDFEGLHQDRVVFVAELKTLEASTNPKGWFVVPFNDETAGGIPDMNVLSRISAKIHHAYEQLERRTGPKVIIFLNDDPNVDIGHLQDIYADRQLFSDDNKNTCMLPCCEADYSKRIMTEKTHVDLFLWIDRHNKNKTHVRTTGPIGEELALALFVERT